jgi:ABC-type transport system substrate-binding protein
LPIDTLDDVRHADFVHDRSFEIGYHYMMHYNMRRAPLDDVKVRQAIDLAIDRTALSQALQGGNPTRSLFPDFSSYYSDTSSPAGDLTAAATLLDEAGWRCLAASARRPGLTSPSRCSPTHRARAS